LPWAKLQAEFAAAMNGAESALASEDRLGIYRANITLTKVDALSETYRAVRMVVGDAYFEMLAKAYSLAHPARSGDLAQYGDAFAAFIDRHAASKQLDYLSDLARFEWAWHRAFYAASEAASDWRQLPRDTLMGAKLQLSSQLQWLSLRYDASRIWDYCVLAKGEGAPPELKEGRFIFVIHRGAQGVRVDGLSEGEYSALRALAEGETLEYALAMLTEDRIRPFFTLLLERSWVTNANRHETLIGD